MLTLHQLISGTTMVSGMTTNFKNHAPIIWEGCEIKTIGLCQETLKQGKDKAVWRLQFKVWQPEYVFILRCENIEFIRPRITDITRTITLGTSFRVVTQSSLILVGLSQATITTTACSDFKHMVTESKSDCFVLTSNKG